MPPPPPPTSSREARFVASVLQRTQQDKGLAARLRRADNPATEYQSWEFLADWGINLEDEAQRLPFTLVAAAMAKAKLRRVLACDDVPELCRILRPVLALIDSRVPQPLDYIRLLQQLHRFAWDAQKIKSQWAQEFYGRTVEDAPAEEAA